MLPNTPIAYASSIESSRESHSWYFKLSTNSSVSTLTHASLPWPLQSVGLHLGIKVRNVSGVAPRLEANLLANSVRKPVSPAEARECHVHAVTSSLVNEAAKLSNVVIERGKLDQLAHESNGTIDAHIFVANDGFGGSLSQVVRGAQNLENFHGLDATVDVEGHASLLEIGFCSTYVVEKAGASLCDGAKCRNVLWQKLLANDLTCMSF